MKTLKPERPTWETLFNEDVSHQPPHVTAEYLTPEQGEGLTAIRLRPAGDDSGYSLEVSLPGLSGDVRLSAVKTFDDPEAGGTFIETVPLKLYHAKDMEAGAYFDPRSAALHDARGLVFAWGRDGLDTAMSSAYQLAQENGYTGKTLFEYGHPDTFTLSPDAPSLESIHARREDERERIADLETLPPSKILHSRTLGESAYDFPLEEGQAYGFRARTLPAMESQLADYEADAVAVEAVKTWREDGQPHEAVVTLGVYHVAEEALTEVNVYAAIAGEEGVQAAMWRAAMLADAHTLPGLTQHAEEYGLHLNPDVRYGKLFQAGPPDPFLSEQEMDEAAALYRAENPYHHTLSLDVIPLHDREARPLGFSVMAIEASFEPDEPERTFAAASGLSAYELAHFTGRDAATTYMQGVSEYMDKRGFDHDGTDITPALDFVKGVGNANGFIYNERWLMADEGALLDQGAWSLNYAPEDFQPLSLAAPAPEMEL